MKVKFFFNFSEFLKHAIRSFFLFGLPLSLATYYYYPSYLFLYDGGIQIIKMALALDLILGPVIVGLIYKVGKKGLKFDLIVIMLFQLGACVFGIYNMYNQRPLAAVFAYKDKLIISSKGNFENKEVLDLVYSRISDKQKTGLNIPAFVVPAPKDTSDLIEQEKVLKEKGLPSEIGRIYYYTPTLWEDWGSKKDYLEQVSLKNRPSIVNNVLPEESRNELKKVIENYKYCFLTQMRYSTGVLCSNDEALTTLIAKPLTISNFDILY